MTGSLDLVFIGDLRGDATSSVQSILERILAVDFLDQLVVDLRGVVAVDSDTVAALMSAYVAAVQWGTSFYVVGAQGRVRHVLLRSGVADVLADSEDFGALMLAVLSRPPVGGLL